MKKKDLLLSSKKYYVTVSENNCRCHQMEQSEMRPHWHDLEYTMKLQPQIPYEHKIYYTYLLILCIHTWNSFYYQNIRWGQRGEGGVGIPRYENTNLYFHVMKMQNWNFWVTSRGNFFFRIRINLLTGHPFSTAQRDFAEMGIASSDMLRDFLIEIFFLLQLTNLEKKNLL